jgi:hypothetical protein
MRSVRAERSQIENSEPPLAGLEGKRLRILQHKAVGASKEIGIIVGDAIHDCSLPHDSAARQLFARGNVNVELLSQHLAQLVKRGIEGLARVNQDGTAILCGPRSVFDVLVAPIRFS